MIWRFPYAISASPDNLSLLMSCGTLVTLFTSSNSCRDTLFYKILWSWPLDLIWHLCQVLGKQCKGDPRPYPPGEQPLPYTKMVSIDLCSEGKAFPTTLKWNLPHSIWRRLTSDSVIFLYFSKIATWPNILFSTLLIATCLYL